MGSLQEVNCQRLKVLFAYLHRGISVGFGSSVTEDFLDKNKLELVCRAHEVVEDGYELMFDRKVVTVFSAPNYCGEFDNAGAMMILDDNLVISFKVIRPMSHMAKVRCCNENSDHQDDHHHLKDTLEGEALFDIDILSGDYNFSPAMKGTL